MWFRNLIVYTAPRNWDLDAQTLAERLAPHAFAPATSLEEANMGWVSPRDGDPSLVYSVGPQMLLALREEKKLLPAKVISQVVKQRAEQIEEQEGIKPGRRRLKELKEQVRDELLPRAFSLASDTRVWIDPVDGWICVDTSSANRAGEVFTRLVRAIDGFPAKTLRTVESAGGAMTAWLVTDEPPVGFTIDQDVELRARDSKATVRFANQTLAIDDVTRHTQAGKQCTKVALTWAQRVSFVLTDKLEIKRVRPLDVIKDEGAGGETDGADADERFASDWTLMTGELSRLLADVVQALGGRAEAVGGGTGGGAPPWEAERKAA
ncbi:MAG TPA: recombination-associated protein RdgC [Burkholderiaceae bacterium]|nr:recombination-associated protein RdgC [Burkholderiaceae bacterium]